MGSNEGLLSLSFLHASSGSHYVPASSGSRFAAEDSPPSVIETRLCTQAASTPMSCAISSVDIPERRRFSTSSSRQTSPLLSKGYDTSSELLASFIPVPGLAFPDTGARIIQ